ncbi:MAG TPA: DUF4238 domain-containing protein, partial [Candidatus Dormibacteraeota bacterium]
MNRPARRHHYLSRFLMRGFSERPDAANPPIWKLDKATGKPSRTSINSDAVVKDFYRLQEVPGLEATQIETDLAKIEGIAAVHLSRLVAGGNLSQVDRFELASYINLQHRRTPRGRQWFVEMYEHMSKVIMDFNVNRVDTDDKIRDFLRQQGSDTSDDAVLAFRTHLDDWRSGHMRLETTSDHEVMGMFMANNQVAIAIASQMTWTLLRSDPPHEFVLGDHPICMYDPTAIRGHGVGWMSSRETEVSLPVGRYACLVFKVGTPICREDRAAQERVMDLNLRSYATAEWSLFGATQLAVQTVRADARRNTDMIHKYQPRKPH